MLISLDKQYGDDLKKMYADGVLHCAALHYGELFYGWKETNDMNSHSQQPGDHCAKAIKQVTIDYIQEVVEE